MNDPETQPDVLHLFSRDCLEEGETTNTQSSNIPVTQKTQDGLRYMYATRVQVCSPVSLQVKHLAGGEGSLHPGEKNLNAGLHAFLRYRHAEDIHCSRAGSRRRRMFERPAAAIRWFCLSIYWAIILEGRQADWKVSYGTAPVFSIQKAWIFSLLSG